MDNDKATIRLVLVNLFNNFSIQLRKIDLQIQKLEAALKYKIDDLKSLKKWPMSGGKEKGGVMPLAFLLI